jgi:hypothetical protein
VRDRTAKCGRGIVHIRIVGAVLAAGLLLTTTARADTGTLPDTSNGRHRFYTSTVLPQPAGCSYASELRIWSTRGRKTSRLLDKVYSDTCDGKGVRLIGDVLHVDVRDEFKAFYTPGCCAGRQVDWRIRVGKDGVEDLGETPDVPELDIVDSLFENVVTGRGPRPAATPGVVALLRRVARPHVVPGDARYGDLDSFRLNRRAGQTDVCPMIEPMDGGDLQEFRFVLVKSGVRQSVAKAELIGRDAKC